jgi:hypothetical protein
LECDDGLTRERKWDSWAQQETAVADECHLIKFQKGYNGYSSLNSEQCKLIQHRLLILIIYIY